MAGVGGRRQQPHTTEAFLTELPLGEGEGIAGRQDASQTGRFLNTWTADLETPTSVLDLDRCTRRTDVLLSQFNTQWR